MNKMRNQELGHEVVSLDSIRERRMDAPTFLEFARIFLLLEHLQPCPLLPLLSLPFQALLLISTPLLLPMAPLPSPQLPLPALLPLLLLFRPPLGSVDSLQSALALSLLAALLPTLVAPLPCVLLPLA